jgi:hypothetical protein
VQRLLVTMLDRYDNLVEPAATSRL